MKKGPYKLLRRLLYAGLSLALALSHPAAVFAAVSAVEVRLSDTGSVDPAAASSGTIRIGDVTFSSDEDVSSHWSEGRGWKNLAGQYIALVDYNGAGTEISMDSGSLTLGVAGVNRIGTLKGDCSVHIVGTGIVLIDSIEIEEGNGLFLHPNTALYETGSAAVFLLQNDGSYRLINGGIPGILDEDYTLDNVRLTVPDGSSLVFSAWGIRTETWVTEDSEETDVRRYKDTIPWDDLNPFHENGRLDLDITAARLVLGSNSRLTVESEASLRLEQIICQAPWIQVGTAGSNLVVEGVLDVRGLVEGGLVDIHSGGSLAGNGTVRSAQVELGPGGDLSEDLLLEKGGLTIKDSGRTLSLRIKDAAVYLKASRIFLENLIVEGTTSWLGVESEEELGSSVKRSSVGDITFSSGGSLEIVCNEHSYVPFHGNDARYAEDCFLTISGRISGGTVRVLAGCVHYTGTQNNVLPAVPDNFASRVYVTETGMPSTLYPVNMTDETAAGLADEDYIPVSRLFVWDSLIVSGDGSKVYANARKWEVQSYEELAPLERTADQYFTCTSFLEAYNLQGQGSETSFWTAVEVIYSDLSRVRRFMNDNMEFSTENAILIRVLDCMGMGGQGGSAISHNETSFSGSGTLGRTGSGSVTYGNGTVVFPPGFTPSPTEPETTSGEPETSSSEAETTSGESETTSGEPETTSGEPETTSGEPETTSGEPETTSSEPETTSGESETTSREPETTSGDPETSSREPETKSSESETTSREPVTTSGTPEPTSGQPETGSGENETESGESATESGEDETETRETETESQETVPESGDTEPESGETEPESGETESESGQTESESSQTESESGQTESESGQTESESAETETEAQTSEPETEETETRVYGDLTVVVTPLGNGQYSLSVYRNDIPLDGLDGQRVTAAIRDPQGVTEGDLCCAVFDDDSQRGWIPADYDPLTKELTFSADRTGTFSLVRLHVEEVYYRTADTDAPLYRRLTARCGGDELAGLPGPFTIDLSLTPAGVSGPGLYAVFADKDENLDIFPLTYDAVTQKYRFETDATGNFVLVKPDAPLSGSELYDFCRASDEVRILITVLRLYAFWY